MVSRLRQQFDGYTTRQKLAVFAGIAGALICIIGFALKPSFPTPDKLCLLAVCVGLIFQQALMVLFRLGPFAILLFTYDSFRGFATDLNGRVNYMLMPDADRWLFGSLPTAKLQQMWWHGKVQWYDFVMYVPYLLHFVFPFSLAIVVWKLREKEYWRVITAYISISFFAFFVFVLFPAAPPWMASDYHLIEPITRVSSYVWSSLGIQDFPSLYNRVSPNPVAAVPSLHAAYATLFALFVIKLFKSRWRYLSVIYPVLIYLGTVYQGEHYAFDEIVGALLGIVGYYASPWLTRKIGQLINNLLPMKKYAFSYVQSRINNTRS